MRGVVKIMMVVEGYAIGKVSMGYTVLNTKTGKYLLDENGEVKIYLTQDTAFEEICKLI